MTRDKNIYKTILQPISKYTAVCFLLSSAGTYIKEFVHGDLGRTQPSLGDLFNCRSDIIQLDVLQLYEKLDEVSLEKFEQSAKEYATKLISILK